MDPLGQILKQVFFWQAGSKQASWLFLDAIFWVQTHQIQVNLCFFLKENEIEIQNRLTMGIGSDKNLAAEKVHTVP